MYDELKKIFEKQLHGDMRLERNDNIRTYFGRTINTNDKLLFAIVAEKVIGSSVHMIQALLTERDFPDLSRKFTLDESLTNKQYSSSKSLVMPVFVKDKILNEYRKLKGIKVDG